MQHVTSYSVCVRVHVCMDVEVYVCVCVCTIMSEYIIYYAYNIIMVNFSPGEGVLESKNKRREGEGDDSNTLIIIIMGSYTITGIIY